MDRRNLLLAGLSAPLFTTSLEAQEDSFTGTPLLRVDADPNETKRTELSDAAGQKYECRVLRKGRKYVWASRDNRELIRANAGDWTYYISPEGTGYVKVFTGAGSQPYDYMEHLTTELKTLTYWGRRAG